MHVPHNTQTLTPANGHAGLQVKLASVDALGQALFAGSPMRAAAAEALEACARDEPPAMSHGPVGGVVQRCLAELLVREPCGGGAGGGGRCWGHTDIAVMSAGEWEGHKECVRVLGALETQYHDGFAPLLVWVLDQAEEAAAAAVERFRQLPQAPPEGGDGEGVQGKRRGGLLSAVQFERRLVAVDVLRLLLVGAGPVAGSTVRGSPAAAVEARRLYASRTLADLADRDEHDAVRRSAGKALECVRAQDKRAADAFLAAREESQQRANAEMHAAYTNPAAACWAGEPVADTSALQRGLAKGVLVGQGGGAGGAAARDKGSEWLERLREDFGEWVSFFAASGRAQDDPIHRMHPVPIDGLFSNASSRGGSELSEDEEWEEELSSSARAFLKGTLADMVRQADIDAAEIEEEEGEEEEMTESARLHVHDTLHACLLQAADEAATLRTSRSISPSAAKT